MTVIVSRSQNESVSFRWLDATLAQYDKLLLAKDVPVLTFINTLYSRQIKIPSI